MNADFMSIVAGVAYSVEKLRRYGFKVLAFSST